MGARNRITKVWEQDKTKGLNRIAKVWEEVSQKTQLRSANVWDGSKTKGSKQDRKTQLSLGGEQENQGSKQDRLKVWEEVNQRV